MMTFSNPSTCYLFYDGSSSHWEASALSSFHTIYLSSSGYLYCINTTAKTSFHSWKDLDIFYTQCYFLQTYTCSMCMYRRATEIVILFRYYDIRYSLREYCTVPTVGKTWPYVVYLHSTYWLYTVIRFFSITAKFGICTVVGLHGTFVEAKIRPCMGHLNVCIFALKSVIFRPTTVQMWLHCKYSYLLCIKLCSTVAIAN